MKMAPCSDIFKTDLLIESRLICEIKGVRTLVDEHIAQLLGYLASVANRTWLTNQLWWLHD